MTNSVQVFDAGFRVTDANGDPVSGAKIKFYEAGTSTPKNVYSDEALTDSLGSIVYTRSDGFPVAEEGSSTTVLIFTGTGAYKIEITDTDDVVIFPAKDNVKGAVAVTDDGTPIVTVPVESGTGTITVDATSKGKLIRGNTSGGDVTASLAAAATLGDGWSARFIKGSAANTFIIDAAGSDLINGLGSINLEDQYDYIEIVCDGTGFYVAGSRIKARGRDIGDIRISSYEGARTGELICDGSSYLRADYPALFAVIGTAHGAADSTHFNVPKYSGRFLRVWDNAAGVDPDASSRTAANSGGVTGDEVGTLQDDALKTHTHTQNADSSVSRATGADAFTGISGTEQTGIPSTGAANETRGKNVYVAAYILAVTF